MVIMPKIEEVKAIAPYKLRLMYDNGQSGEVDLAAYSARGQFTKWDVEGYFQKAYIPGDHNAVAWDEELELCSNALYLEMIGKNYIEYVTHQ